MNFQNAQVITKKKIQEIEQVCRQCNCACPVDEEKEETAYQDCACGII